jgi:hypothetical protein
MNVPHQFGPSLAGATIMESPKALVFPAPGYGSVYGPVKEQQARECAALGDKGGALGYQDLHRNTISKGNKAITRASGT